MDKRHKQIPPGSRYPDDQSAYAEVLEVTAFASRKCAVKKVEVRFHRTLSGMLQFLPVSTGRGAGRPHAHGGHSSLAVSSKAQPEDEPPDPAPSALTVNPRESSAYPQWDSTSTAASIVTAPNKTAQYPRQEEVSVGSGPVVQQNSNHDKNK